MREPLSPELIAWWNSIPRLTPEQFVAAAQAWRRPTIEPFDPTPIGYDEEGAPILSQADWFTMFLRNYGTGDPVPRWLQEDFPLPVTPGDVRGVVEYLREIALQSAEDSRAGAQGKGGSARGQQQSRLTDLRREAARRSVDNDTRYADEAVMLGIGEEETKRTRQYLAAYAKRRERGMSRDEARREADALRFT